VHRTLGPQDVKAIRAWIQYHGESDAVLAELAGLKKGEAFVWAPDFPEDDPVDLLRVKIRHRETFDSSATPKAGELRKEPKRLAEVDLDGLRDRMTATIERAKEHDPAELHKRIRQLKVELAKKAAESPASAEELDAARAEEREAVGAEADRRVAGVVERIRARDEALVGALRGARDATRKLDEALAGALEAAETPIDLEAETIADQVARQNPGLAARSGSVGRAGPSRQAPQSSAGGVRQAAGDGLHQRVLDSLAWLEAAEIQFPSRRMLGFLARGTLTGGYGANIVSRLRSEGLVDYPADGIVALTDDGRALANTPAEPLTIGTLQARVLEHTSGLGTRVLGALLDVYPGDLTREEAGARVGATLSGGYGANVVSKLHNTAEVITYPAKGRLRAAPWLFLEDT